jgi:hypothetical protein
MSLSQYMSNIKSAAVTPAGAWMVKPSNASIFDFSRFRNFKNQITVQLNRFTRTVVSRGSAALRRVESDGLDVQLLASTPHMWDIDNAALLQCHAIARSCQGLMSDNDMALAGVLVCLRND